MATFCSQVAYILWTISAVLVRRQLATKDTTKDINFCIARIEIAPVRVNSVWSMLQEVFVCERTDFFGKVKLCCTVA